MRFEPNHRLFLVCWQILTSPEKEEDVFSFLSCFSVVWVVYVWLCTMIISTSNIYIYIVDVNYVKINWSHPLAYYFFSEGTCSVNIWFCSVSAEYVITRQTEQVRRNILFFSEGTCSVNIWFCFVLAEQKSDQNINYKCSVGRQNKNNTIQSIQ